MKTSTRISRYQTPTAEFRIKRTDHLLGRYDDTNCVLKPVMNRAKKDEMRKAQLSNTTHSLHHLAVKDRDFPRQQLNRSPHDVVNLFRSEFDRRNTVFCRL